MHPHVRREINRQLKAVEKSEPNTVAILDVPLLIEGAMHKNLRDVIVVYTPEDVQIKRLMQRDNISEAAALARVRSQMPIEEKKKRATLVIDNSGSMEQTRKQTLEILKRLNDRSS